MLVEGEDVEHVRRKKGVFGETNVLSKGGE
jgi:hypothetical protein